MSLAPSWDSREAKILVAVGAAIERGEDPGSVARASVPELTDELYMETVASLEEGGFLHAQVTRLASGKIGVLFIERLTPRGLEAIGRWRRGMTALEVDQRITDLSQHPEAELETFFLAYGLGDAFNAPGKGWGRQKRVNAALTEANRQGRRDEVLEAASVRFAFQAADPPMAPVPLLPSLPVAELTDQSTPPVAHARGSSRWIFLVQGRNHAASEAVTELLESANLRVIEWEQAVRDTIESTGRATPYIGEILTEGMKRCHAVVALFTPDDVGGLHPALWNPDGTEPDEQQFAGRARQNVVFEAGMALGRDEAHTILVELGRVAGFSDIAGRHAVRLDNSPTKRKAFLDRLAAIGCDVDLSGTRWMTAGNFADVIPAFTAYPIAPEADGGPDHTSAEVPTQDLPMTYFGPTSWFQWSGPSQPDVTFRIAVALPGVVPQMGTAADRVTRLRGEARERLIEEALNQSPVTTYLNAQREVWHWQDGETSWGAYGNGYPEFTEYRFVPIWPDLADDRIPFLARAGVLTGWRGRSPDGVGSDPALQIAVDLTLNLLDLDSDRRREPTRHTTSPVPAALSITEVADLLLNLWPITDVASDLVSELLPPGNYEQGQVGIWLQVRNAQLNQVIDLNSLSRLPASSDAADGAMASQWPVVSEVGSTGPRDIVVEMLLDMLERSGFRRLGDLLDGFRNGTASR